MDPAREDAEVAVVAGPDALVVVDPREGAFNLPPTAIATQFSAILDLESAVPLVRNNEIDAAGGKRRPQRARIVCFVGY